MIKPALILAGLLLVTDLPAAGVEAGDLEEAAIAILSQLQTPSSAVIPFVELRKNKLLEQPMVLSGEIDFSTPGRLSKRITSPFEERVTISSVAVEMERDGKTRRLPLKRKKGLVEFYTGLNALLEQDVDTLMALFDVESLSDGQMWSIVLIPANASLEKSLEQMVITGTEKRVTVVRTIQSEEVWQEMSFGMPDSD